MKPRIAASALLACVACRNGADGDGATVAAAARGGAIHLSVEVRTGDGAEDGADGHAVELCLSADYCLPIDFANADVLRPGRTDVLHVDELPISLAAIDRVVLRSRGSADAWRPSCVAVAIDGATLHCDDTLDVVLGGEGESAALSWTDPAGVHVACASCSAEPITHGPVVGAVTPVGARLWVRTDLAREVVALVHDDDDPAAPVVRVETRTWAEDDFTAILDVPGLAPTHHYRAFFESEGALAATSATFHTPPAPGSKSVFSLAFGSCARTPPQSIFDVAARAKPDFFVFGGDNTYADSPRTDVHWAHLRAALEHRARADFLATTPSIAIWDDHDFIGNDSNGTWKGRAEVLRAFEDYFANTSLGTPETPGVFSTFSWGDVEVFLLDVRSYRSPDDAFDGSMLGAAQEKWLQTELLTSTATFKILVSGSVWGPSAGETWLDHPEARERLFDFLSYQRIPGVVLLGGDLHRSMLRRLHRPEAYPLPEIVSSPLSVPSTWACPSPDRGEDRLACFDGGNAVALLAFDTTRSNPRIGVRILDEGGNEVAEMEILGSALK